jgi:hypothetical protein
MSLSSTGKKHLHAIRTVPMTRIIGLRLLVGPWPIAEFMIAPSRIPELGGKEVAGQSTRCVEGLAGDDYSDALRFSTCGKRYQIDSFSTMGKLAKRLANRRLYPFGPQVYCESKRGVAFPLGELEAKSEVNRQCAPLPKKMSADWDVVLRHPSWGVWNESSVGAYGTIT